MSNLIENGVIQIVNSLGDLNSGFLRAVELTRSAEPKLCQLAALASQNLPIFGVVSDLSRIPLTIVPNRFERVTPTLPEKDAVKSLLMVRTLGLDRDCLQAMPYLAFRLKIPVAAIVFIDFQDTDNFYNVIYWNRRDNENPLPLYQIR